MRVPTHCHRRWQRRRLVRPRPGLPPVCRRHEPFGLGAAGRGCLGSLLLSRQLIQPRKDGVCWLEPRRSGLLLMRLLCSGCGLCQLRPEREVSLRSLGCTVRSRNGLSGYEEGSAACRMAARIVRFKSSLHAILWYPPPPLPNLPHLTPPAKLSHAETWRKKNSNYEPFTITTLSNYKPDTCRDKNGTTNYEDPRIVLKHSLHPLNPPDVHPSSCGVPGGRLSRQGSLGAGLLPRGPCTLSLYSSVMSST